MQRVQEAIEVCLEFENEVDESLEFVGIQKVAVSV